MKANKKQIEKLPTYKKHRNYFSEFIDKLLAKYEQKPGASLHVNIISRDNSVEKRRLYDLLNVLVACDVCSKSDNHTYKWKSLQNAILSIKKLSYDIELNASVAGINNFESLLLLPDTPSIGLITNKFIGLFLFLNRTILNITDVALLMSLDKVHYKPILRRLYLVGYFLERIGILDHVYCGTGEYHIKVNVSGICQETLKKMAIERKFQPDTIEYQLNRFDESAMDSFYHARRYNFAILIQNRKAVILSSNDSTETNQKTTSAKSIHSSTTESDFPQSPKDASPLSSSIDEIAHVPKCV